MVSKLFESMHQDTRVPELGSMVVSESHWSSSSSSSLSLKEGTTALSNFGHVSIHLDHSDSCMLNLILLNLELDYKE